MELLVKAVDATHIDPIKDRRGCYKKGYPISVKPDGWANGNPNWYQSKYAEFLGTFFVIIKCPEVTVEQAQGYIRPWEKQIDYEIISSNPTNGNYQIRVFGENVSASGQNILTKDQVENYLLGWNCVIDGFAANEVIFTLRLWQALQSTRFWQADVSMVGFTLVSYNSQTGDAIIDVNVSGVTWKPETVVTHMRMAGGQIISYDYPTLRFTINKESVLNNFKRDVKQKLFGIYCRRIYYFSPSDIDTAIAANGIVTLTRAQLLNKLNSKLDE
jgi:hypothetical protein